MRTLRLRRDRLAELTPDELRQAVGAAPTLFCTSALTHCDPVCTLTDPVQVVSRRVLVLGDSTAFHGPEQPELLTHPGLYPNVLARELGAEVDCLARAGWTARDAWWALTKDPYVYSILLPRASAVVLGVGGSDHLPASLPTYLREGIAYLRPGWLRRRARLAYHLAHPHVVRLTGGRMRVLPLAATIAYLTRCVEALRMLRPDLPVVGIVPPPYDARYHGFVSRPHDEAVAAHRAWATRLGVPVVDQHVIVEPHLRAGALNSDGMHWSWQVHEEVGRAFAAVLSGYPPWSSPDGASKDLPPDG